ncbi:MAG: amidophosphoribosyltransferase [Bdellovibrionales bacterium]|nr:amidophosphoribosyltransferase [Bdellovibrionales bacterium]
MSFHDKCAVVGVWNHPSASFLTYLSLYALQHRGQEGAGIVSLKDGKHLSYKNQGLVGDIFTKDKLDSLKGKGAIGHTRYSTTGLNELKNIQPLTWNLNGGPLSVAHNGNIVNHALLKKKFRIFTKGESDTECLLPLIKYYEDKDIGQSLLKALAQLEGAYSLVFLTKDSLIVARDPMGFRPLVLGQKDQAYIVASETCAFDLIGAKYLREIKAGEILIFNKKGMKSLFLPQAKKKAQCIFEYVYFSRPDSLVFNKSVYEKRKKMGEYLAKEHPVEADVVIPVPDSGIPAAIAYSQTIGIPYEMGIIRNHYVGRTFIQPSSLIRNFKIKIKLNPQAFVKGKKVVAIDDSIVRGSTSKALIEVLKTAGAKEVHLRVSSPPIKGPCYYGVDTPQKKQLISGQKESVEEIRQFIGADSLAYLSYENFLKIGNKKDFCLACFDEKYPTAIYN